MPDTIYNLRFASIELISKSLFEPPILTTGFTFTFNFIIDIKVDAARKIAIIVSDISITELGNGNKLGVFKIACVFELPQFESIFTKIEENKYDMPVDLEIILKSASFASVRGIIFSELRGTYLHSAILPLVDIATLVKSDREKMIRVQSAVAQ